MDNQIHYHRLYSTVISLPTDHTITTTKITEISHSHLPLSIGYVIVAFVGRMKNLNANKLHDMK